MRDAYIQPAVSQSLATDSLRTHLQEGAGREGFAGGSTIRLATVRDETTNENPATVFKCCVPQLTPVPPPLAQDFSCCLKERKKNYAGR